MRMNRQTVLGMLLVFCCVGFLQGTLFGETKILSVKPSAEKLGKFERLTVYFNLASDKPKVSDSGKVTHVTLAPGHGNPHDPENIKVDGVIKTPGGKELMQPCFYEGGPNFDSKWQLRFTPRETGSYSYQIKTVSKQRTVTSKTFNLEVTNSEKDGFLRVNPDSYFTFLHDSGKLWRGVGQSFCWESWFPVYNKMYTYEYVFDFLEKNNGNFIRTWMCPWNLHLEWNRWNHGSGLGKYDAAIAKRLDEVVKAAQQKGVYIMLCFEYPGVLQPQKGPYGANDEWKNNPYNKDNGGPCEKPSDFFTNTKAKQLYKNRLRYIVARWGYSPNILCWEFWNEVNHVFSNWGDLETAEKLPEDAVVEWHHEMAKYLKSVDAHGHMVTTSVGWGTIGNLWESPDLDFSQDHFYADSWRLYDKVVNEFEKVYNKPHVLGESGYDWRGPKSFGLEGKNQYYVMEMHLALWRGMFTPTPVLPPAWWWEFYEHNGHFASIKTSGEFSKLMLKNNENPQEIESSSTEGFASTAIKSGDDIFVFLMNRKYGSTSVKKNGMPKPIKGGVVTIPVSEKGRYEVQFYNTYTGEWFGKIEARKTDSAIEFEVPELQKDLACRIVKK